MARLVLQGITKRYGDTLALDGVDLEVDDGEACVLVGPSGCGKSTLLRVAAGLVRPDAGRVLLDGRDVTALEPSARDVAMVFQNYALYPHMTVAHNLGFPLRMRRWPRGRIEAKVREVAARLELGALLDRKPAQLSGGQMQRVALGRAIVRDPALFLFDEPLSNLDARLRTEMRGEIATLCRDLGVTSLYVTHDQAEAMTMGRRVCVLEAGRVRQIGPPLEVYERPANAFVASFTGHPPMNLLRVELAAGRARLAPGLEVDAPEHATGGAWLGVRPDELRLAVSGDDSAPELPALRVRHVEALGSVTHALGALLGHELWVTLGPGARAAVGDELPVDLGASRLHWFDAASGRRLDA